MKLRHAATLALVGWYLVFPHTPYHSPKPDLSLPISKWSRVGPVPSKPDCEARRLRSLKQLDDPAFRENFRKNQLPEILAEARQQSPDAQISASYFEKQYFDDLRKYLGMSLCLSADDPRLAN
jgi:hypothetical protein